MEIGNTDEQDYISLLIYSQLKKARFVNHFGRLVMHFFLETYTVDSEAKWTDFL